MNSIIESVNGIAASWAPTMFAILWQSTLVALVAAVACRLLHRQSPSLRYWIWLAVAAKLLVAPLWTAHVEFPAWLTAAPSDHIAAASPQTVTPIASNSPTSLPAPQFPLTAPAPPPLASSLPSSPSLTWQSWLLLLWLTVVIAELVRTAWQFRGLKQLLAGAGPLAPPIAALVAECARSMGLRTAPNARQIDADGSPMVCGLLHPVLLLPASIPATFDAASLRQILLHELAHIRRRDLATVWIIHAMRTFYWFHPVAHWIAYRAGLERELACDALALAHSGATPSNYARTLIRAAGRATQPIVLGARPEV